MTAELETTNPTPDVESERNGEDTPAVQAAKPKRSHHKMPSTQPLDPEQIGKIQQRNRCKAQATPAAVPSLAEARAGVTRAEEYLYAAVAEGLDDDELDAIRDEMWDARMSVWSLEKGGIT